MYLLFYFCFCFSEHHLLLRCTKAFFTYTTFPTSNQNGQQIHCSFVCKISLLKADHHSQKLVTNKNMPHGFTFRSLFLLSDTDKGDELIHSDFGAKSYIFLIITSWMSLSIVVCSLTIINPRRLQTPNLNKNKLQQCKYFLTHRHMRKPNFLSSTTFFFYF